MLESLVSPVDGEQGPPTLGPAEPANAGKLVARLAARFSGRGHPAAAAEQQALDAELHGLIREIASVLHHPAREQLDGPPPRRVAIAIALAVFSQPHLGTTLALMGHPDSHDEQRAWADDPLLLSNEVLERALGLTQWELDDIRDEVDRRAGTLLKQARVLEWIWGHFGLPEANPFALFRVLFPGAAHQLREVDLVRRGAQMYAVVSQDAVLPVHSLFLGWLGYDVEQAYPPLSTFRARYVDVGLRRALARSIGATEVEVDELLDAMVTIVPAEAAPAFMAHDAWRSSGMAAMTGLGRPYTFGEHLGAVVRIDDLGCASWLERKADGIAVTGQVNAYFDGLAVPRVQAMMQQLYVAMISGMLVDPRAEPDLALFDTQRNMRAVLEPILAALQRPEGRVGLAAQLGVEPPVLDPTLDTVAASWRAHTESAWLGDQARQRYSLAPIITAHLVVLHASLRELVLRERAPRWEHKELLLLFTAHYLAEARLERLWLRGLSDTVGAERAPVPPPEDIPGSWFWATWQRVLGTLRAEANATLSF